MSLKDRLSEDMKDAMRARDPARLESIRMLRAAIQRREVDARLTLDDDGVLAVLQKQAKQHQDSIAQFEDGGREDLASKEREQLKVLQSYLPEQMDQAEVDRLIAETLQETGAASMKDMGRVMALIKPKLQGRADMGAVSSYIKARLQG
jgi:uncharacterized protein YqeY